MVAAVIAVIGTLGGVIITATAGVLTARTTGRNQRELTQAQLTHDVRKAIREEKRTAFVEFLQAYDDAYRAADRLLPDGSPGADFFVVGAAQVSRLNRTYLILCISAERAVRDAANDSLGAIWEIGKASNARDAAAHSEALTRSKEPRDRLRAAMRAELGTE